MDSRNVMYMVYGFSAVWIILFGYLIILVARERSLNGELERVKRMMEEERQKK
jgi:CcmD family protein